MNLYLSQIVILCTLTTITFTLTLTNSHESVNKNRARLLQNRQVCYTTLSPFETKTQTTTISSTLSVASGGLAGAVGAFVSSGASTANISGSLSSDHMNFFKSPQYSNYLTRTVKTSGDNLSQYINIKYEDFIKNYKPYDSPSLDSSQYVYRSLIYESNLKKITEHNDAENIGYQMGLNKFCDLSASEFTALYAKLIIPESVKSLIKSPVLGASILNSSQLRVGAVNGTIASASSSSRNYTTPPRISIDWSCKASPIINQGICGSCFAIAPLESIFITLKMYSQFTLPMSIQEIVSCADSSNGAYGCGGGYFTAAFNYNRVNGTGRAIMYPYSSRSLNEGVTPLCNNVLVNSTTYKNSLFKIRDAGFIGYGDCAAMINRLKTQAVAVSIATTNFQFYVNGTYNVEGELPNHGVTLVGYHPDRGYKVKNSWGVTWGNSGYAYVSETTGVCDYSMYPITGYEGGELGACCV